MTIVAVEIPVRREFGQTGRFIVSNCISESWSRNFELLEYTCMHLIPIGNNIVYSSHFDILGIAAKISVNIAMYVFFTNVFDAIPKYCRFCEVLQILKICSTSPNQLLHEIILVLKARCLQSSLDLV